MTHCSRSKNKRCSSSEDHDRIIEEGFLKFFYDVYVYRTGVFALGTIPKIMKTLDDFYVQRCTPEWEKRSVQSLMIAPWDNHPFFTLSLARSFARFTEDLYYRPEIVEKVFRRMTDEWIETNVGGITKGGPKAVFIVEERASAFYYPLTIFERFWWPYMCELVHAMWAEGIVTVMHLDTDWAKNLPYFKRDLPRGSYVLQLDSMTDMVAAKKVLEGHAMFYGDLPPGLEAYGSVQDVVSYCKVLIDDVGYEGGFILGTGCDTAPDFKPENLKAMVETAKTYVPQARAIRRG